jgi:hypothetical protein
MLGVAVAGMAGLREPPVKGRGLFPKRAGLDRKAAAI